MGGSGARISGVLAALFVIGLVSRSSRQARASVPGISVLLAGHVTLPCREVWFVPRFVRVLLLERHGGPHHHHHHVCKSTSSPVARACLHAAHSEYMLPEDSTPPASTLSSGLTARG